MLPKGKAIVYNYIKGSIPFIQLDVSELVQETDCKSVGIPLCRFKSYHLQYRWCNGSIIGSWLICKGSIPFRYFKAARLKMKYILMMTLTKGTLKIRYLYILMLMVVVTKFRIIFSLVTTGLVYITSINS